MNYVTETSLLVSSSVSGKQQMCFVHDQGQKVNKNIQQRKLSGSMRNSLELTSILPRDSLRGP